MTRERRGVLKLRRTKIKSAVIDVFSFYPKGNAYLRTFRNTDSIGGIKPAVVCGKGK